jgi:molybdate transport system substrate-binding protein
MLLVVVAAACGGDSGDEAEEQDQGSADALTIWAPKQIQTPVDVIVRLFQAKNPDIQVEVVYEQAEELNDRLLLGQRPDLYLGSARQINELVDAKTLPENITELGADAMQMVVAPGNPKGISELSVFGADPTTVSGLCDTETACGRSSRTVLNKAKVEPAPDVLTPNAGDLLNRIEAGTVDVGLLLRSLTAKAERTGRVSTVPLPTTATTETAFRIVEVRSGDASDQFLEYVQNADQVQKALQNAGLAPLTPAAP